MNQMVNKTVTKTDNKMRNEEMNKVDNVIKNNSGEKTVQTRQTVEDKRQREKETVSQMITLYCRKKHGTKKGLCPECAALEAYARLRSDKCPFMETKTFCSNCKVHCYKSEMREKIREVMRFSGPRMLFVHPIMAIRHVIESKREKRRLEKNS